MEHILGIVNGWKGFLRKRFLRGGWQIYIKTISQLPTEEQYRRVGSLGQGLPNENQCWLIFLFQRESSLPKAQLEALQDSFLP